LDYKAKDIDPAYKKMNVSSPLTNPTEIDLSVQRQGDFYYLSSTHAGDQQLLFIITDMAGQILHNSNYLPNSIDLSEYSPGMYLFNLYTENGKTVEKIIVTGF
jgi:hypothetical protein